MTKLAAEARRRERARADRPERRRQGRIMNRAMQQLDRLKGRDPR